MRERKLQDPVKVNILIERKQLLKLRERLMTEGKGRSLSQFVRDSSSDFIGGVGNGVQDDVRKEVLRADGR